MKNESRELLSTILWISIWILIYSALYMIFRALLPEIFKNAHFFQVTFLSVLVYGLCFSISSRIIYSLLNKDKIYVGSDVFFFWTFAYGFSVWFFEFLRDYLITKQNLIFLTNTWIGYFFIGLGIFVFIKIIQQMEFGALKSPLGRRNAKAPSQIFTGIILFVFGILCWRFSKMVFIDWFNWPEGMAWSLFIGFGLMIAGFLVLLAWWRNNVLQHRIGIKWGHW